MRRAVALALLATLAAALAGSAQAKGPTSVTIDGPGLAKPIRMSGSAEGNSAIGTAFFRFVQNVGYFEMAFPVQPPSPLLLGRPHSHLGSAYTVTFHVPGAGGRERLTETLYPHAAGGAVAHMPAGQPLFGTQTHGGWFRAPPGFGRALARLGIPPEQARSSGLSSGAWAGIGIGGVLAMLGGLLLTKRLR